jgi:ankyrin repeat protein
MRGTVRKLAFKPAASAAGVSTSAQTAQNPTNAATSASLVYLSPPIELREAAARGDVARVQQLLKNPIDVNLKDENGWTALWHAALNGHIEVVRVLLQDKDSRGKNRLDINIKDNNEDTLLIKIAKLNGENTKVGEVLRLLKDDNRIDINSRDKEGKTVLHHFVQKGDIESLKLLLDYKGIDLNAKDSTGKTPLHYAVLHQQEAALQSLLNIDHDKKTEMLDINAQDNEGNTALHYAAVQDKASSMQHLLADIHPVQPNCCRLEVNLQNNKGETPFHLAVHNHKLDVINALIKDSQMLGEEARLDLNPEDNTGKTPLQYAEELHYEDILQLFESSLTFEGSGPGSA